MMQAVILAGGLGTRLRPLTDKVPKPMVTVAGKPFLHWQIMDLRRQGISSILLLVAYLGRQIETFFGDGSSLGVRIQYSHEPSPMGSGGALLLARDRLEDRFLLINGDSFLSAPLQEMADFFLTHGYWAIVSTFDRPAESSVIPNLKIRDGAVAEYRKGGGLENGFRHIDSGIYVVDKRVLELSRADNFPIEDWWPTLISTKKLGAFAVHEKFYDIGTRDRLEEFETKVLDYFRPGPQ